MQTVDHMLWMLYVPSYLKKYAVGDIRAWLINIRYVLRYISTSICSYIIESHTFDMTQRPRYT